MLRSSYAKIDSRLHVAAGASMGLCRARGVSGGRGRTPAGARSDAQHAAQHAVERAVGSSAWARTIAASVAPDQIAGARTARGERPLDRRGDLLGRDAARSVSCEHLRERRRHVSVLALQLRRDLHRLAAARGPCPRSASSPIPARPARPGRASCAARRAARRRAPRSHAWTRRREPLKGTATRPPIEETNTIRPRAARSAGSSARVTATCPNTLTSNCIAQVLGGEQLQRAADTDAGVVDERVEAPARATAPGREVCSTSARSAAAICARRSRRASAERPARRPRLASASLVPRPRRARRRAPSSRRGQAQRGGAADAGRGAGDRARSAHRSDPSADLASPRQRAA